MRRLITKHQAQILKLVHHDFDGLSQAEAAKKLDISKSAISSVLMRIKKILPQYFPILTKLEAKCYYWYTTEGWPVKEIAECTGQSEDAVYKTLQRARDKGMYFTEAKGRILSYEPSMDAQVIQKF